MRGEIKRLNTLQANYKTDTNTRLAPDLVKKFPFLKLKSGRPSFDEILTWESTREKFPFESDMSPLINHFSDKITGIYKHGQSEKTGLCNTRILSNITNGYLTIAITKNTLDAKQQWEERLIKKLKEIHPTTPLKDMILVISSKKNDLQGNATHCKSVSDAWYHFSKGNFRIIFVCSNKARIDDILQFLDLYESLAIEKRIPIDIQHDEAHSLEDGVPARRESIEHIILSPYVESYVPVTASYHPLILETSHLWKKANLDRNCIDYTKNSAIISTSPNYSSISDAHKLTFETMMVHSSYKNYGVTEFDEATFQEGDNKEYAGYSPEDKKADQDKRRQLEFCPYMRQERLACNLGMNILDNTQLQTYTDGDTTIETPLILAGVPNFHIMTTPLRVAFTIHLMKHAIKQSYNPIIIGLYRSSINFMYRNYLGQIIRKKFGDLLEDCRSEELNCKIHDILEHIKATGESIARPVLIMGNYKPTGESITFVNFQYGTIRSQTLLPIAGLSKEKSYQGFLRCCYMDTKFRENDPDFVHPPKWMIGFQSSINDAILYEQENDERIMKLLGTSTGISLTPVIATSYAAPADSTIAAPLKLTILEMDDPLVHELWKIFAYADRTAEQKKQILVLVNQGIKKGLIDYKDPTGKFDFSTYTLKAVRTWKQHSAEESAKRLAEVGTPFEDDYRFREYDSHHRLKEPYLNNKSKFRVLECDLLTAFVKYEYNGFINHKSCMWLGYRSG